MGYQIIQQPPDRLAIFSSYTDTVIVWDATEDEIVEWFAELAAASARRDARRLIGHVVAGNPRAAYFQFAMTWEEALAKDRRRGGTAWKEFHDG